MAMTPISIQILLLLTVEKKLKENLLRLESISIFVFEKVGRDFSHAQAF